MEIMLWMINIYIAYPLTPPDFHKHFQLKLMLGELIWEINKEMNIKK